MDIINVNNKQVIECPHCKGTGMCKEAQAYSSGRKECSRCGEGAGNQYPVCAVCDGKGYTTP